LKIYEKIFNQDNLPPLFEGKDKKDKVKINFDELNLKERPNGMDENSEETLNAKTSIIVKKEDNKPSQLFIPYAICLWSSISNIDSFREIFQEIHKLIFHTQNVDEETVKNFQFSEMNNIFNFLNYIVKPPNKSILKLNLRKNNI